MKRVITAIAIMLPTILMAQADTSKIDNYCELVAQGKFMSNKISIDLDFGEGKNGWSFKNTKLKDEETGKVRKFKSIVDALNYMGYRGWKLLNAFPVSEASGMGGDKSVYHFFFVKTFDRSEMVKTAVE